MKKKEIPQIIVKAVMSLYKEATAKITVKSIYLNKFSVKVEVHQSLVLSPFLFATVIDVVTEVRKRQFLQIFMQTTWFFMSDL